MPLPLAPPTSFVGRERDVAEAAAVLAQGDARLLSLTGPGGIGKTRLALAIAAAVGDAFPAGVHLVDLAAVPEPDGVLHAIAQAIEAVETRELPLAAAVVARLGRGRRLLVLDNFEHVLAAGPALTALLTRCSGLSLLVTSRVRLHLSAEHERPVPPLELPAMDDLPPERLAEAASVRLFVDRARAADDRFALASANAAAVATVCRRVDGVPLAIELAAARIRVLPPAALASRLGDQLTVLTGGPRDAPPRLRSMRDAVAWSHDLLGEHERVLFRRLAVFVGGFTLDAAERVGDLAAEPPLDDPPAHPDPPSVLDGVTALLDANLLRRTEPEGAEPRLGMLEPVREFGLERLAASGEEEAARDAHAAHVLRLAETAESFLLGPEQPLWFGRLEADLANLHAALDWLRSGGHALLALRLAGALGLLWTWPPYLREGRTRLEATLTMADATSHPRPLAKARHAAGNVAHWQGDTAAAEAFFAAALAGWRTVGDELNIAAALRSLASLAMERGDLDRAEALLIECRPLFARLGHAQGQGFVAMTLGFVASARGDHRAALRLHEASLAAWASVPGEGYTADALANIGWERLLLREPEAARPPYVRALAHARAHGDERGYATAVEGAAGITAIEGDHALAARLFAAAAAIREAIGVPLRTTVQEQLDGLIGRTRSALGEVAFWLEWEAGRVLPVPEALDLAAALLEPGLGAGRDPWSLTRRERDVLRLLAQGRSDKEIAAALFVERRTASKHVSAILAKLGVPSRAAAVALAFKHGLA